MSGVIFARPRHEYDSYNDLYALITLSGYPLIYADEIDAGSDNCYIVTLLNGETQGGWPGARAEIILWDLEWRVDAPPDVPGVRRVWASDMWYAEQIKAQYVPFGSHPALCPRVDEARTASGDGLAAMMYTGPHRRNLVIEALRRQGVVIHDPAWGGVRHKRLTLAAAMLHIHQHDRVATVAPLRWALAAAYNLPVIGEVAHYTPAIPGTFWLPYDQLIDGAQYILKHRDALQVAGEALCGAWCYDRPFAFCVEAAL